MKKQLNEMISLIERMNNPRTGWGQVLNESTQVAGVENLEKFLSRMQITEGYWCGLGYIQIYPSSGLYPNDELRQKMMGLSSEYGTDNTDDVNNTEDLGLVGEAVTYTDRAKQRYLDFMDKSKNAEWDAPMGRAYNGQKSFSKNIYPYVIKLTKYKLHWQGQKGYANAQEKNRLAYNDMTSKIDREYYDELGIQYKDENGEWHNQPASDKTGPSYKYDGPEAKFGIAKDMVWQGDKETGEGEYVPRNLQYRTNVDDPSTQVEIPGFSIRNMLAKADDQVPMFFGVNENGEIDRIPNALGNMLHRVSDGYTAKLKKVELENNPRKLEQFTMFYNFKRNEGMRQKIFKLSDIVYFCTTATDVVTKKSDSYFWINNKPLLLLKKTIKKQDIYYTANINLEELQAILKFVAEKEADGLASFSE